MASNTVVQNNILALNTHRNMKLVGNKQANASEKLSSGYRINRASDDAAGLAISEKMRAQIRGLDMASKNVSDAISLIKTAEGGMQGIDDMLHRIRELVDYAANDTNENNALGTGDRQKIQDEIDQLVEEIDSMSERVEFNKKKLINGAFQDTTSQLTNAKATFDRTSIDVAAADAARSAIKTSLGAKTDTYLPAIDITGAAQVAPNAANSAYGNLNYYQAILDDTTSSGTTTATLTRGSIVRYKSAVAEMSTAQSAYDVALATYTTAKNAVNTQLEKAGLTISGLNTTTGVDSAFPTQADLDSALSTYMVAAEALGLDELGLGKLYAASPDSDFKKYIDARELGTSSTLGLAAKATALAGYPTTTTDAHKTATQVATKEIAKYEAAKAVFATEENYYRTAVTNRDNAQEAVDILEQRLTEATRALSSAQTINNAASISYGAADALKIANNSSALHFQVGANGNQSLIMSIGSLKSDTLGIGDGHGKSYINVVKDTGQDITSTIDVLDQALSYVTTERSKLGAAQNRMEYTQQSLDITSENITDAESRIRDTDMAKEMMNYTKANILQQVSVSMMAQANQVPQSVLQLLR